VCIPTNRSLGGMTQVWNRTAPGRAGMVLSAAATSMSISFGTTRPSSHPSCRPLHPHELEREHISWSWQEKRCPTLTAPLTHSKPLLPPHLPIMRPSPAQGNSRVSFARLCFKFHRHCSLYRHGRPEGLNLVSGGTQAILSFTLRWILSFLTPHDQNTKD
jgi:hypothetical protein